MIEQKEQDTIQYSEEFRNQIIRLLRGKENWPKYNYYINDHLGRLKSRFNIFKTTLCKDIEYHCGSLTRKRVLDFGCGTGSTTAALTYYCDNVVAFDIDNESMDICKQRLYEHGKTNKVDFICSDNFDNVKSSVGLFDVILVNGVIEHIPLTINGLRQRVIESLMDVLKAGGYLYINETPNRLIPFDSHSTGLFWIPWSKPGSYWAYRKAVTKGRHSEVPTISKGPRGLEEVGAWGATYFEIKKYLRGKLIECINLKGNHNRHLYYSFKSGWKTSLFEFVLYYSVVKLFRLPLTAFAPSLPNLVFKKLS